MKYPEIIKKVAEELGMSEELVNSIYKAYWTYIRDSISALPLKETLTEENFSLLKTNYNIPSLGKLSCTFDRYTGVKKRFDLLKSRKNNVENKED